MTLSREQVELFHNNGYIKLPDRFDAGYVQRLRDAVLRDMRDVIEPVVRDEQGRIVRLSQVYDRGGVFRETIEHPLILDSLESILGPSIVFTKNRHNHATLNLAGSRGAYWHRDIMQWTRTIVTVLVYIEDSTVDNGCTHVVPGTHKMLDYHINTVGDVGADDQLKRSGVLEQGVQVPMPPGGMLLINSLILHRVGDNHTDNTRMSVTFGYHGIDELYGDANSNCVLVRGEKVYTGNTEYKR